MSAPSRFKLHGICNVLYGLVSTLKNSSIFRYRSSMVFFIQLIHSYCRFISQLHAPQIASKSFELGLRGRLAHFHVSQPIRVIRGQEFVSRGPDFLSITCFPGNQAQIELIYNVQRRLYILNINSTIFFLFFFLIKKKKIYNNRQLKDLLAHRPARPPLHDCDPPITTTCPGPNRETKPAGRGHLAVAAKT